MFFTINFQYFGVVFVPSTYQQGSYHTPKCPIIFYEGQREIFHH